MAYPYFWSFYFNNALVISVNAKLGKSYTDIQLIIERIFLAENYFDRQSFSPLSGKTNRYGLSETVAGHPVTGKDEPYYRINFIPI